MTKVATIYDKIVDILEAQLTGYVRLPNPYDVQRNTYLHLQQGFGIGIGPGVDTERYTGCLVTWERVFNIILVKRIVATQNNVGSREIIEKSILDDVDKLRKAFYVNTSLDGEAIETTVSGDGGITFIDDDQQKFLSIELQLFCEYQENPNA